MAAPPILLTRPAAQMQDTAEALRRAGFELIELPLTRIEPPARKPGRRLLAAADAADWLIFTSRNAVAFGVPLLQRRPRQQVMAIGPATAQALRARGWPVDCAPADASTEAALADEGFARAGQRALIIAGSGGRRTLKAGLEARGLTVDKLIVYRRRCQHYSQDQLAGIIARRPVLILTSGHAMRCWAGQTAAAELRAGRRLTLLVASPRLCKLARRLGFEQPAVALPRMSDSALLQALTENNP